MTTIHMRICTIKKINDKYIITDIPNSTYDTISYLERAILNINMDKSTIFIRGSMVYYKRFFDENIKETYVNIKSPIFQLVDFNHPDNKRFIKKMKLNSADLAQEYVFCSPITFLRLKDPIKLATLLTT